MQLQVSLDHFCDVVAVSGGSGTGCVDVRGHVMELKAVLVSHNWASCGSCICSESYSSLKNELRITYLKNASYDCGSSRGLLDLVDTSFLFDHLISSE